MRFAAGLLLLVFAPMLAEWRHSLRNERGLRRRGAVEAKDDVYVPMSLAYPAGFVVMIAEGFWRQTAMGSAWLPAGFAVFVAGKALKYWAMAALGRLWSFRVLIVPGTERVTSGPYRWVPHPNYAGILGELSGVALMAGAWISGPAVVALFGYLLWRRIAAENAALEQFTSGAILRRG